VDSCYRYGGDELTIIMPETSKQDAKGVTERIREQLNEHFHGMITASVGIAESTPYMEVEELIGKADRAMYNAKTQGGNRTILVD
jgi:diguanylate cyclase (GGDEF)-like protein